METFTERADRVDTRLGSLAVRRVGEGDMTVLWSSMFVDSHTWDRVLPLCWPAHHPREFVLIDPPGLGRSDPLSRRSSIAEAADAARDALDGLGATTPVDWVGNAFGGHVGYQLATDPSTIRSFVAISAPTEPVPAHLRRQIALLHPILRLIGAVQPVRAAVISAMLTDASAATPGIRDVVVDSLNRPTRASMSHALRSFIIDRTDVTDRLPRHRRAQPVHRVRRPRRLEPGGCSTCGGILAGRHIGHDRRGPHTHSARAAPRRRAGDPRILVSQRV